MPAQKLIGKPAKEFFCDNKAFSSLGDLCKPVRAGKVINNFPIRLPAEKGRDSRMLLVSILPLPGQENTVAGAVICMNDASDQGYIYQVAINSVADGVFTVDEKLKITSFNRAAEELTGWKVQEVIGRPCRRIFQCSICDERCLLEKSITSGRKYNDLSIFIKGRDGAFIPVNISAAPLLDERGDVIGGINTFRDNTASLREKLILNSIADGVFTVDRNWRITSFNRAAETITGWREDEAIGKSCGEVFQSSICGKSCAIAESLYSGRAVSNRSITIVNRQGEKIPISISASPLVDHEGNIIGGVETFRDLATLSTLRRQLIQGHNFDGIISKNPAMQRLFTVIPEIARSPSTVLILGESGTGKELIAQALYHDSERKDRPFVTVNCGALPETLLESELFGYKAGAFTDARTDKEGRFAAAEGGTLFLDEIGDIPPGIQVKLLRVLQEKVYEPLGSNLPVKADVRIITATNRDLQAMVRKGTFRDDLFYRLNVVKIQLPPLRERKEDIPLLIDYFIKRFRVRQGKDIVGISAPALDILMRHNFPGNIRELENIIEYAFILCEGGYILPRHLPEPFTGETGGGEVVQPDKKDDGRTLEEIEKQAISLALERNRWKKHATCLELNISKDTLRRKIDKYGLDRPVDKDLS